MGIEAQFTKYDVRGRFDKLLDTIEKQQIKRLMNLGEMCVNHARSIPKDQGFEDQTSIPKDQGFEDKGFEDQTGNLRSSIGYAVFVDGVAVHSRYEPVTTGSTDGSVGAKVGADLSNKIGKETNGVCLVVTAGMNYALHVESRGRDVIASAEQLAERELPKMLESLIGNIKKIGE